jgi:hypothetical protein
MALTKATFRMLDGASVNVKDYGALGDGTTDDSASIQLALDSGASYVLIPSGVFNIQAMITIPSNVTVKCEGTVKIGADIDVSTIEAAIWFDTASFSSWAGGTVDASSVATYSNNIFRIDTCTECELRDIKIIDSDNQRYPLSPIRSSNNTRNTYSNISITSVADMGLQTNSDDYCSITNIRVSGGVHTGIETNGGTHNIYTNCIIDCTGNTTTSAFGFNDTYSVVSDSIVKGGAYGITVGHTAYPADYSSVLGNTIDSPSHASRSIGINVQATKYATINANTVTGADEGLRAASGTEKCVVSNNIINNCGIGIQSGKLYTTTGNIVTGFTTVGYKDASDGVPSIFSSNIAADGSGVGFQWGIASAQKNTLLVGNLAADTQATPTQTYGFRSLSNTNTFIGNATDGNHVTAETSGITSSVPMKDFSDALTEYTTISSGTTGGTGAAGAGNQYVEIDINGTKYKILHDGTI